MAKKKTKESPSTVTFDFIKSNYFRVVSVDGIFGGVTPRASIFMSVWSQRGAMPDRVVHEVTEGELGEEIDREGSGSIIREHEVGLVFDEGIARAMIVWLEDKLKQLEGIRAAQKSKEVAE